MKGFVSLTVDSRLALKESSVLSHTTIVTFAEPTFSPVMIGFMECSLDLLLGRPVNHCAKWTVLK